jgi:hypothetical protein
MVIDSGGFRDDVDRADAVRSAENRAGADLMAEEAAILAWRVWRSAKNIARH